MTNDIETTSSTPFDFLRQQSAEGKEYWSARDLMAPLGYDSWRRFADSVERAKAAAANTGALVGQHFANAVKVAASGPTGQDYRLSRFAAYLVAMNGDPRKPEVAAAQSYFAIKTREAEVVQRQIPQTYASALRAAAEAIEAQERAEAQLAVTAAKVEADAPKVRAAEEFFNGGVEGETYNTTDAARMLGIPPYTFRDYLRQWNWITVDQPSAARTYAILQNYAVNVVWTHPTRGSAHNTAKLTRKGLERAAIKLQATGVWKPRVLASAAN